MSKRQDRQGVRTPADVERKYNLGGLRDMMSRIAAQASDAEAFDALSKEVAALEKVVENTAGEMWQTQGEMQESLETMQGDMTIVKQDFLNTAADVDDLKEDMTPLAEFSDGEYSGVVGFVARANADSATIATLLEFSQDDDITLAMFMAEASKEFATIESLTLLENNTSQAIAGVKQEASETYATIAMLSSYVDKDAQTEALAAFRQESNSKYATQEMLTGYVSDSEQTEALAGLRQEADGKYATQEMLTGYVSEKDQTEALAGLRQEVSDTYATQEMLSSYVSDTEQAQAIAGLKQEVSGIYATQEMLTQLETETGKQIAAFREEVSEGYASVSQIAEVVDENGKVTAAAIVAQINEGKSSILLESDAIDLKGYVTITGLEDGSTTIDGACIKTGKIDADRIDVDYLSAISANIGTVTAGVLTSENPFSAIRIDLTNGTMNMNGLYLDAEGNLSVEGEIKAKSGYIGEWDIETYGLGKTIRLEGIDNPYNPDEDADLCNVTYTTVLKPDSLCFEYDFETIDSYDGEVYPMLYRKTEIKAGRLHTTIRGVDPTETYDTTFMRITLQPWETETTYALYVDTETGIVKAIEVTE